MIYPYEMIISYPARPSRIIVLSKTLRHIIDNLKKKSAWPEIADNAKAHAREYLAIWPP